MNIAILIGNLTRDPELRTTQSGISCCQFTVAVNRRFTNQQGVREADFINIVTWRQQADLCARYLSKGRKVGIRGTIQTRTYDAQDGTKRYVTEVVADEVEFIGQGGAGQGNASPLPPEPNYSPRGGDGASSPMDSPMPSVEVSAQSAQPKATGGFPSMDDDDLPF